jgi:hypothetical protein
MTVPDGVTGRTNGTAGVVSTVRTTRRPRVCEQCRTTIQPGQPYYRLVAFPGGELGYERTVTFELCPDGDACRERELDRAYPAFRRQEQPK